MHGNTALHLMLQVEEWYDVNLLKLLVNHEKFDPNVQNQTGNTVMHVLCLSKQVSIRKRKEVFHLLIQSSHFNLMNPSITDYVDGNTPLHLMVQSEEWWDSSLLIPLIKHKKCNPNVQNKNKDTVFHIILSQHRRDFTDSGSKPDALCHSESRCALFHVRNQKKVVEILTTTINTIGLTLQDQSKDTPLHLLVQCFPEIGIELIWKHLDTSDSYLDIRNQNGDTAIHILFREVPASAESEVVTKLCQIISKLNPAILKNKNGDTILHSACYCNIKQVLDHLSKTFKGVTDLPNSEGKTPLHIAAASGNSSLIQPLVKVMKANLIAEDKTGNTPLHLAFLHGHVHVVRAFLSCGMADCNVLNDKGETPLHIAAVRGYSSLIQPLTEEMQADPVARDKQENTPLHHACQNGHLHTVKALLSCGRVKFDVKNAAGMTPIQLATTSEVKEEMSKYQNIVAKNTSNPFMKLFVIGNSGAGKSTLIRALCSKDFPTFAKLISKPRSKTVTKPESCTSGIIPYMCTSSRQALHKSFYCSISFHFIFTSSVSIFTSSVSPSGEDY